MIVSWVAPTGRAQEAFDAASIKLANPGTRGYSIRPLPGRVSVSNATLKAMIAEAYHVYDFQISGGPKWIDSDRFDIEAKAGGESRPSDRELMKMLQKLLADRFSLTIQRKTENLPVFALEVAKGGPKIQPSKDAEGTPIFRLFQRRQITAARAPLAWLVETLSHLVGRPVLDKTGLTAVYDYQLEWSPDELQMQSEENVPTKDGSVPSLGAALRDQLGLRLQTERGPVEILVITRAEKATGN